MMQTISLQSASNGHTKPCLTASSVSTSSTKTIVVYLDQPQPTKPDKAGYRSIRDFVAELEQDEGLAAELAEGRAWVADTYYAEEGDTIRTLRLRRGWSQTQLAEKLGTSQPHIARIETHPTDQITVSTCRRLCTAFQIDQNTLNVMLLRQDTMLMEKRQ